MKKWLTDEFREYRIENTVPIAFRGWGAPKIRAWIAGEEIFDLLLSEGDVIWKVECVSSLMWTPGIYDVYRVFLGSPDSYRSRDEAEEKQYASCRPEYLAVRREKPLPEQEKYEQLLEDLKPHLSHKNFDRLLQELEGRTPEEKEDIIREAMDELTTAMSYY